MDTSVLKKKMERFKTSDEMSEDMLAMPSGLNISKAGVEFRYAAQKLAGKR